jgi:pyrimidine deaminase RibD-like protein
VLEQQTEEVDAMGWDGVKTNHRGRRCNNLGIEWKKAMAAAPKFHLWIVLVWTVSISHAVVFVAAFSVLPRVVVNRPPRSILHHHYLTAARRTRRIAPLLSSVEEGWDDSIITSQTSNLPVSNVDLMHMRHATDLARIGYGNTYPNPAVGCILVRHDDIDGDIIVGSGFHPRAGMPHAEVFALLEASGYVNDGVEAARSVMSTKRLMKKDEDDNDLTNVVSNLLDVYKSPDGTTTLFGRLFANVNVTAFVTLEPCCHYGKTPPCASSLIAAGVKRVVVGCRDPNPRVDGGGVRVLKEFGINVQILDKDAAEECSNLIKYFVQRISPRPVQNLNDVINGKKRRALRSVAGRHKHDGTIQEIEWPRSYSNDYEVEDGDTASCVPIDHRFLESLDGFLWDKEIVLLRLNGVVQKKKGAKILSERVAEILDAHVAQVIGHTALLYRPAIPPILDLEQLVASMDSTGDSDTDCI